MPPKKTLPKNNSSSANKFNSLAKIADKEEKQEKTELHDDFDIWKLLMVKRQKCRSIQYQLWAAILIEKEGLTKNDVGLKDLIESILIDPKMGDQHIAKLPAIYRAKMSQFVKITLHDPSIAGNVNKYAVFLQKWHSDLKTEITMKLMSKGLGYNYIIKDKSGNDVINPALRSEIKKIIQDNSIAKKIREKLNLTEKSLEEKEVKEEKFEQEKIGEDDYINYLIAENEKEAKSYLEAAVKSGYMEDDSGSENSEEYFSVKVREYLSEERYSELQMLLMKTKDTDQTYAWAQYWLGVLHDPDHGHVPFRSFFPANADKAEEYYKIAAAKDCAAAQHNLGLNYINKGIANLNAGIIGRNKKLVDKGKGLVEKAMTLFEKAADQDWVKAQHELGMIYCGDYGTCAGLVKKDDEVAASWWKKAANQGYDRSQHALGDYYTKCGQLSEGEEFLEKAANQGLADAQNDLGAFYIKKGGIVNEFKAMGWWEKAAKKGCKAAVTNLENNKDLTDLIRKTEDYKIYYFPFDLHPVSDRTKKLDELVREAGLDQKFIWKDEKGTSTMLPPLLMTKENREALGLDYMKIDEITEDQTKSLERFKVTIVHNDNNKISLTWPIHPKLNIREIINKFLKIDVVEPAAKPKKTSLELLDEMIAEVQALPSNSVTGNTAAQTINTLKSSESKSK